MKEGWEMKKLGEMSKIMYGHTAKTSSETDGVRYLRITDIQNGLVDWNSVPICPNLDNYEKYELKYGDIVFARTGATTGKSYLIKNPPRAVFASYLIRVQTNQEEILPEFLSMFFQSASYWNVIEAGISGSAQGGFNAKKLGGLSIPIPPLPEQKQIVTLLDAAFAKIDQAKANIEKNIANAKELFQSKLNEIFSQKGNGWEEKMLKEMTTKIGSGSTPKGGQSSYKESGISLIRSMNVHDDGFRKKKLAFIDDKQASKLKNVTIKENDVLLNITGASVARCCIVDNAFLPARVNQHVSIIRLKEGLMNYKFLHYALTSKQTKSLLLDIGAQGATRQAITKVQIENFRIAFPISIDVQDKLVNSLDELRKQTTQVEMNYNQKLIDLTELKKSLLQKAFAGELT